MAKINYKSGLLKFAERTKIWNSPVQTNSSHWSLGETSNLEGMGK